MSSEINDHISEIMCYIPDTEPGPRCTMDKKINTFGRRLISICKSSHFRIVNGRHQFDPDGSFTYCGPNGRSVVDLLLTNSFKHISYFNVSDLTEFSDHTPIDFSIQCSLGDRNEKACLRPSSLPNTSATVVKWKEQLETQMRRDLISNLDSLYSCVVEGTDVNQMVEDFSENLNNVLGKYCKVKVKHAPTSNKKAENKPWFNHNCELLYKKYLKALEEFNKHHSKMAFTKLNNAKSDYKKLQKKLKNQYKR